MAQENDQHAFFIDDELVERLMRGDAGEASLASAKKKRPAESASLGAAVVLATAGRLDEAIQELDQAAAKGESPFEVQSGLGHLHFEQQRLARARGCYRKGAEAGPGPRGGFYKRGPSLARHE